MLYKDRVVNCTKKRQINNGTIMLTRNTAINLPFVISIFISATLVFLIQPIVSKSILPHFGGGVSVWIACMLYFQFNLFVGYLYAHLLTHFLPKNLQIIIHVLLIIASFFMLKMSFNEFTIAGDNQTLNIFAILFKSIFLPCMLVSASSPLLQYWYHLSKHSDYPYWFYSVSNIGSMLGLLGYPFLIELVLPMSTQKSLWVGAYFMYVMMCFTCLWILFKSKQDHIQDEHLASKINYLNFIKWVGYSFLGCVILLAVTLIITNEVFNLPLIWLLPLALYLTTFIWVFSSSKRFDPFLWKGLFVFFCMAFVYFQVVTKSTGFLSVINLLLLMFSACMICHGQLKNLRPNNQQAPIFYLAMSAGGLLGGIMVNLAAPIVFNALWEFYLAIVFLLLYLLFCNKTRSNFYLRAFDAVLITCTIMFGYYIYHSEWGTSYDYKHRNFYGIVKIYNQVTPDDKKYKIFKHGLTIHGVQVISPQVKNVPNTYFHRDSGLGLMMQYMRKREPAMRVGVAGLGVGTIAAWGRKSDQFTFYEIDQDIVTMANDYFSYLSDSLGEMVIKHGDARLLLQQELNEKREPAYDVLILDAFSGDAPPFHLLTKEALELYLARLQPNGAIAYHISSRYFNFSPIIHAIAKAKGLNVMVLHVPGESKHSNSTSQWAIITRDQDCLDWMMANKAEKATVLTRTTSMLWTDEYNTLLPFILLRNL